jgi:hypothetical protein
MIRRSTGLALALALALALTFAAAAARAQIGIEDEEEDYQSPRMLYFEFKLGPYAPNIDSEFGEGTTGPFAHIFGDGTDVMIKGELDLQFWQGFGSLGVGAVIGYYGTTANPYLDTGDGTSPSTSSKRSASETSITLIPLSLLAVYRFDWPAIKFNFPLVPFVKFGLNYTIWWIDVDGKTASYNGDEAAGGSVGWQFNAGAALLLDVLEPKAAKTLDVELGINHTYLFFELAHVAADGFGSETSLNVGDTSWNAGIAFEF